MAKLSSAKFRYFTAKNYICYTTTAMVNEKIKLLLREIALHKDQKAYKELFVTLYENLHRFAFSILKSKEDAEEVVSDFFITIW